MGVVGGVDNCKTIKARLENEIGFIQIYRPEANNAINDVLIQECSQAIAQFESSAKIIVLEGLPEVFCFGADFKEIQENVDAGTVEQNPGPLYDLWLKLASGSYITIAHVRGKANAGGIGFVSACDLVLCEEKSTFSLSELLFGLMPACVMPFLMRRMSVAKVNRMTLMTQPISAAQAMDWGLVDDCAENSQNLLRKYLLRLRRLSKSGISDYKSYLHKLDNSLVESKPKALAANIEIFSNQDNLDKIVRYVKTGKFPWEGD